VNDMDVRVKLIYYLHFGITASNVPSMIVSNPGLLGICASAEQECKGRGLPLTKENVIDILLKEIVNGKG